MQTFAIIAVLLALSALGYRLGRGRALASASGDAHRLHSLPSYYGSYVALWSAIPALILVAVWLILEPEIVRWLVIESLPADARNLAPERLGLLINDIRNLARGDAISQEADPAMRAAAERYAYLRGVGTTAMVAVTMAMAIAGLVFARRAIHVRMRARVSVERVINIFLLIASTLAIMTTVGIVLSLLFEALRFFKMISPVEFLFGLQWSPQTAIRADQVGSSGAFGAVPIFAGTLMITAIAMAVAVPIGLYSAIYMSEYASPRVRALA